MYFIRDHQALPAHLQKAWVTIGNFDGMHLGHQRLLHELKTKAKAVQSPCGVIIFEPQGQEFFSPNPPARLSTLRQKYQAFKQQGIDFMLVLRFNDGLAALKAEDFMSTVLVKQLHIHGIIIGQDFRFGHKRQGDFSLLLAKGKEYGFSVTDMPDITHALQRVSSTQIRQYLAAGELDKATELLGHPFTIEGKVMQGAARGRTLNMRTANIALHRKAVPFTGIFVVRVRLHHKTYPAVASLGTRPVFNGKELVLEVHLLDFSQDIYGERIQVEFLHKLRDEQNFDSVALLQAQMQQDLELTKKYWENQYDKL